jgi:cytochrome c biogenesis protein CcmG/thiol:disulfide interchange protein DsbE
MTPPGVRTRALAAALVMLAAVACDGGSGTPSLAPATNAASADGLPSTVGGLPTLDPAGFDALLEALHGTPVVVNFWASWCEPCIREAPILDGAHARLGDRVQFLGVDIQDARDGALRFLAEHDVRYPSVFDPANAIGTARGLFAPPMTIVYDAEGNQVATFRGELSAEAFDAALAGLAG